MVSLWGPDSRRTLAKVSRGDLSTAAFPYLTSRVIDVARGRGPCQPRELRRRARLRAGHAPRTAPGACGTRSWPPAGSSGSSPSATTRSTRSVSRSASTTGGTTSARATRRSRRTSASACGSTRATSSGAMRCSASRRPGPERKLVPLVLDGQACVLWGGEAVVVGGAGRRPGPERRLRPHGRAERRARVPSGGADAAGYRGRGGVVREARASGGPDGPALGSQGRACPGLTRRSTGDGGSASGGSATSCPTVAASRSTRCACPPWPTSCRSSTTADVVLIRQYRPIVGAEIWELPAGTIEAGESPEACARRELVEEAGYEAGRLDPLGGGARRSRAHRRAHLPLRRAGASAGPRAGSTPTSTSRSCRCRSPRPTGWPTPGRSSTRGRSSRCFRFRSRADR